MLTKRFTAGTFALSALVAFQSAGAQERNLGQTIPSNGQPQVSDQQISATQNRQGISGQPRVGQPNVVTQQPTLPGTAPTRPLVDGPGSLSGSTTTLQGTNQQGTYEARRTPTDSMQAGMTVQQAVLHKLMRGNQSEIELAQLAQQEAKSDKVKQFAQMMIKDHQQALQEVQQQQQSAHNGQNTNSDHANSAGAATANGGRTTNGNTGVAGQNNAGQTTQGNTNQGTTGQANGQNQSQFASMHQERVPQQLVQLMDRTCDNALQQSKEMLKQHRDEDFDMAYMGQQIVMHSMMLAELKALESDGPKQLQPVVQSAKRTTESHMKEAKQIVEQLASNHPDQHSDQKNDKSGNKK